MTKNAIELKNITKSYKQRPIFKNLNLNIEYNQITTIYGPSGCGKSTLLNIIGLLEKPDSGTLYLLNETAPRVGSSAARLFLRNKISYLFQNFALINDFSIKKNLDMAQLDPKESKQAFIARKEHLLKLLNIDISEKTKVGLLSGGEQQRIAFVRCLLKPCQLILCDEPTGSLDPDNKQIIFEALEYAKKQGKTIVIVSHDPYIIKNSDNVLNLLSITDS